MTGYAEHDPDVQLPFDSWLKPISKKSTHIAATYLFVSKPAQRGEIGQLLSDTLHIHF